jgi:hypothetical protein
MKRIIPFLVLTPFIASAQLKNVSTLLKSFGQLVSTALPIVVGLALLGFFWGLAMFIFGANDEDKRKEGRSIMIWGVVALFVMVAVWGLVNFLGTAIGVTPGTGGTPNTPTVGGLPGSSL